MPKSPEELRQLSYASIEAKTGISVADWLARIRRSSARKHGEIVQWLKTEHGLGHGHATLLAHDAMRRDADHRVLIP
ncbi:DUF4287 domain-containing protein [Deinococcus alpinitundrae]|uniref:DUF4287 domain-containing protein n=1 Tax=Deinococcus alpinitundrae TaxID=468913 RepID=UPI00137B4D8E|nr:DUF4287 domain-containing protein [Deinococcus alpinitundrae]